MPRTTKYIVCPACELPAVTLDTFDLHDTEGVALPHVRIECIAGHARTTPSYCLTWAEVDW